MKTAAVRASVLAVLVAAAAACAFFSYRALTSHGRGQDGWDRAIATAQRAERTKAVLPAFRMRDQAVLLFEQLARSGAPTARSRAKLLAGLLQVKNAADETDSEQALALAVADLQAAVRLDRSNDEAAYDLELLLSRSVQSGRPIGAPRQAKKRKSPVGKPGAAQPGTGY
jgi:hypothetical protein